MGFVDKLKGMFFSLDEEYDDEVNYDSNNAQQEPSRQRSSYDYEREDNNRSEEKSQPRINKVVNVQATTQLHVVLCKPKQFDEAKAIADHLNAKKTVVLNLESASKEVSRRLVDFLSGVAYANNGNLEIVANSTFIITPYNVDIMGDLIDELENSGVYF